MSFSRTRLGLTALAAAAAIVSPAHAATASAAYWHGGTTSRCTGGVCTYAASSTVCDDLGAACTARLAATVTVANGTCSGTGTLTFTSGGRTAVVDVVVTTGPSVTVASFAGVHPGGTNDTYTTEGTFPAVCAANSAPFVSGVGFAGTFAGTL